MGLVDKSLDGKAESWLFVLSLEHVIVTKDWSLNFESHLFSSIKQIKISGDILETEDRTL